jgi:hypothetical protein
MGNDEAVAFVARCRRRLPLFGSSGIKLLPIDRKIELGRHPDQFGK